MTELEQQVDEAMNANFPARQSGESVPDYLDRAMRIVAKRIAAMLEAPDRAAALKALRGES